VERIARFYTAHASLDLANHAPETGSVIHRIFVAGAAAIVLCTMAACGAPNGALGSACNPDQPSCGEGLGCAGPPFPDTVCTRDCTDSACPTGAICALVGDRSFCVPGCSDRSQCRAGYQCWNGGCTPACTKNEECGRSFQCVDGQCAPFDGSPIGAACNDSSECATRLCVDGKCTLACDRDAACGADETCVPSRGESLVLACKPRRGTAANAVACTRDADCDRGACLLGVCVEMCATTQDCHGSSLTCAASGVTLDSGDFAPLRGCLPSTGTLSFDLPSGEAIPVPGHAKAMAIFVKEPMFDMSQLVGVTELLDPDGNAIYTQPTSEAEFYALDVRYLPDNASSTMLVPNSPRVSLRAGPYAPSVAASTAFRTVNTRIFMKLSSQPLSTGRASLNFYLTDLSSNCTGSALTTSNAASRLSTAVSRIKSIFAGASIDIPEVTFRSANGASNVVHVNTNGGTETGELEAVLKTATSNQPNTVGMDVVLVRSILNPQNRQVGILGIAGGIPSSPILGTPHSGAIVSIDTLCALGQSGFAETTSHEIGHTLGLFHNVESSGQTDPLDDTTDSGQNLMYWEERGGFAISAQQAQVMRNDPKVRQ
jgi:hypothetical protein